MRGFQVMSWLLLLAGTGLLIAGITIRENRTLWFVTSAAALVGSMLVMYLRSKQLRAEQQADEARDGRKGETP